jgi:hypothetical protein
MRIVPKLIVLLAFAASGAATGPVLAAGNHAAEIGKFKADCAASGGSFAQVSRMVYRCTAKNGGFQQCNYTGDIGWCAGQEPPPAPTSTGIHRRHP